MALDFGSIAGAALDAYTGGASGGAASAALSGGGKSSGGSAPTITPNQTAEQRSSQNVTTTVTVGDGGVSALLPLLLQNRADFATVQGYSAESVLSGRGSVGTYAVIAGLALAGVLIYRKF